MSLLIQPPEPMRSPKLLPSQLLPNIFAGLTAGLVTLTYNTSFAALIFSGSLSPFFPQGIGSALIGSVIAGVVVALRSSFPYAIAGPDSNSVAILALMTSAIAHEIQGSGRAGHALPILSPTLFPTLWMRSRLAHCSQVCSCLSWDGCIWDDGYDSFPTP